MLNQTSEMLDIDPTTINLEEYTDTYLEHLRELSDVISTEYCSDQEYYKVVRVLLNVNGSPTLINEQLDAHIEIVESDRLSEDYRAELISQWHRLDHHNAMVRETRIMDGRSIREHGESLDPNYTLAQGAIATYNVITNRVRTMHDQKECSCYLYNLYLSE